MGTSDLLAARVRMHQKYLDQFYDLYEVGARSALGQQAASRALEVTLSHSLDAQ